MSKWGALALAILALVVYCNAIGPVTYNGPGRFSLHAGDSVLIDGVGSVSLVVVGERAGGVVAVLSVANYGGLVYLGEGEGISAAGIDLTADKVVYSQVSMESSFAQVAVLKATAIATPTPAPSATATPKPGPTIPTIKPSPTLAATPVPTPGIDVLPLEPAGKNEPVSAFISGILNWLINLIASLGRR